MLEVPIPARAPELTRSRFRQFGLSVPATGAFARGGLLVVRAACVIGSPQFKGLLRLPMTIRRTLTCAALAAVLATGSVIAGSPTAIAISPKITKTSTLALTALNSLAVKGRAPRTGYSRTKFGAA